MSGPVSYVKAIEFDGSDTAGAADTFYSVSDTTSLPSELWLRGMYYAQKSQTFLSAASDLELWNGNNGKQIYSFPNGVLLDATASVLPEDCYWDINNGLWVRSSSGDIMSNSYLVFFYT